MCATLPSGIMDFCPHDGHIEVSQIFCDYICHKTVPNAVRSGQIPLPLFLQGGKSSLGKPILPV